MKIFYFAILFLLISCNKTVEVEENEIGLVFSNWDGKVSDTFYKSGEYKISSFKGFTAAKIITKTETIKTVRNGQSDTLKIRMSFKPKANKNFELYDKFGLDYDKKLILPLLNKEVKNLRKFVGSNDEFLKKLQVELYKDQRIKKYLEISLESIDN